MISTSILFWSVVYSFFYNVDYLFICFFFILNQFVGWWLDWTISTLPVQGLDTGPVLLQRECDVMEDDTLDTLYKRFMYPEGIKATVSIQYRPTLLSISSSPCYDKMHCVWKSTFLNRFIKVITSIKVKLLDFVLFWVNKLGRDLVLLGICFIIIIWFCQSDDMWPKSRGRCPIDSNHLIFNLHKMRCEIGCSRQIMKSPKCKMMFTAALNLPFQIWKK